MQNYLLSIIAAVGGLALVIAACQTIVYMKHRSEEMRYRKACAIHASDNDASDESTLTMLRIKNVDSLERFCLHYM